MTKEMKASHPKEADVMVSILKEMGITEYEPGVLNQLLEFTYRYVTQILDEARVYANYSKKSKAIEIDDVKLAIHMQIEKSLTTPPPRDLLLELSRNRNSNPLPSMKPQCGIRLPPDRYCLSACNMQLKSGGKKAKGLKSGGNSIKPGISMVTSKTGNTQTVTLVQKPSVAVSAAPTTKIVTVGRPVIKVSQGSAGVASSKVQLSSSSTNLGALKVGGLKAEEARMKRKREDEEGDDEDYDAE